MISYAPFWKTLESSQETTYSLIQKGISPSTLDRMRHGGSITAQTLNDLCNMLHCKVEDIIEIIPD